MAEKYIAKNEFAEEMVQVHSNLICVSSLINDALNTKLYHEFQNESFATELKRMDECILKTEKEILKFIETNIDKRSNCVGWGWYYFKEVYDKCDKNIQMMSKKRFESVFLDDFC